MKQLIYGSSYVLFVLLVLGGIYLVFLKPAPNCFDGVKNGGEEGVDCGGVCGVMCLPADLKPLAAEDVSVFHPSPDAVSALVRIRNPNAALAARAFSYRLEFYDSTDALVDTKTGSSFIYASEIRYLTAFLHISAAARVTRAKVWLGSPAWVDAREHPKPQFSLQDRRVEIIDEEIRVTGRLVHRDTILARRVHIVAVFASGVGRPLAVSETRLDNVLAGETRPFTIIHPSISGVDLSRTEIAIYAERS